MAQRQINTGSPSTRPFSPYICQGKKQSHVCGLSVQSRVGQGVAAESAPGMERPATFPIPTHPNWRLYQATKEHKKDSPRLKMSKCFITVGRPRQSSMYTHIPCMCRNLQYISARLCHIFSRGRQRQRGATKEAYMVVQSFHLYIMSDLVRFERHAEVLRQKSKRSQKLPRGLPAASGLERQRLLAFACACRSTLRLRSLG